MSSVEMLRFLGACTVVLLSLAAVCALVNIAFVLTP